MIQNIKDLLGEAAGNYTEAQIALCSAMALSDVSTYCRRDIDEELQQVALRLAVIMLQRLGSEGVTAESYSGVSMSYVTDLPPELLRVLNSKRRIGVL